MRRLLNVLYVTSPDAYLIRDGENVVVKVENETRFRVPVHNLEGIVTFGHSGASPALMALCGERQVALTFLGEHGQFLARVTGEVSGNVLLRRRQYRVADCAEQALRLSSAFVLGKIANCRAVLSRGLRDHKDVIDSPAVASKVEKLTWLIHQAELAASGDHLRGVEGEAARHYFAALDHLILTNRGDFYLHERNRRPPKDNMNALLSFLYTLLAHDVQAAVESVGLDPQVGFLHADRPGRPSLALDLMEELRPTLADRVALSLVNRRQVVAAGFHRSESGGVIMDSETRKTVITTWQKRKQEEILHPFLGEKIPVGLIPFAQAMLLARHLRGDLDGYPPFFWR
ncbi:MAG: type I-C CRISPR-associated endonuclease Cas1c [Chitinophagales bacterium]